jgi:hypothetical protein
VIVFSPFLKRPRFALMSYLWMPDWVVTALLPLIRRVIGSGLADAFCSDTPSELGAPGRYIVFENSTVWAPGEQVFAQRAEPVQGNDG